MKTQLPYERVKISSLILDPDNAREHDERNLSVIKESLKRFEQQRTIVVSKDNIVIAGNGTVMAAKELGWDTIDITRSQLTGEEAKAFALVDNRSTDLSKYDDEKLIKQIRELEEADLDMILLGFDPDSFNTTPPDYSVLDEDSDSTLDDMKNGVRKAIQIEFELEHYEEAQELVKYWRAQGAYVGMLLIDKLKSEKAKLAK